MDSTSIGVREKAIELPSVGMSTVPPLGVYSPVHAR